MIPKSKSSSTKNDSVDGRTRPSKIFKTKREQENDPCKSPEGQKLWQNRKGSQQTWKPCNDFLDKQARLGNIRMINIWTDKEYLDSRCNKRQNKFSNHNDILKVTDPTWYFCKIAYFIENKNADGSILKFSKCSWLRCKCQFCFGWYNCQNRSAFGTHLKTHKRDMLYVIDDFDRQMFTKITGITFDDCKDDPAHHDQQSKLQELINLYYLDRDHQEIRDIRGIEDTKPIDLNVTGPKLRDLLHKMMIELLISLGSTPMAASKPTFMKFIEVFFVLLKISNLQIYFFF